MIIVSNMAVDLLVDVLTGIIRCGVRINIDVGILVEGNINVIAGVMTTFDFCC